MPIEFSFHVPSHLHALFATMTLWDVLDILIVALILYKIYAMLQGTRAITLVKGVLVLLIVTMLCSLLAFHVMYWLLQKTVTLLFVALPIVFQPELRRALEHLGQGRFLRSSVFLDDEEARSVVNELVKAVKSLSATRTGALLVIEREMGLNDISATGIHIDGLVSADFLLNVFIVNTPLHDGAAVIRGKRLIAAGCLLPLTENRELSTELGTRHRAAIGLSEQCDALVVVVSEETGTISVAENGNMERHLDAERLKRRLNPAFSSPQKTGIMELIRNWGREKK